MKLLSWLKKDIVLTLSILLAAVSCCIVPPDAAYAAYVDGKTLGILFCLLLTMAGLKGMGLFARAARGMLERVKGFCGTVLLLVLLPFFFSMIITNDAALITFVPLALTVLGCLGKEAKARWAVPVVVLQTLAANLGSMLTPIGNPQNLYLYSLSGVSLPAFMGWMLPYTALSLFLLVLACLPAVRQPIPTEKRPPEDAFPPLSPIKLGMYIAMFAMSLAAVLGMLDWRIAALTALLAGALADRPALKQVDYALLGTFLALFVFIGNLGRIPAFRQFLSQMAEGRELAAGIAASQVTSNVPAALLLSGFTGNIRALTLGVNLGGLGTLIASMASLISYKAITRDMPACRGRYLLQFTLYNVLFLAVLAGLAILLG